ncbi:MAG TPA: 4Fe-4S dicluster domain-containing protein [Phycisphaerales bacterium]|nr:4Fe-4S dicluster domain-containing protein [Phycisphaerales bacterium]
MTLRGGYDVVLAGRPDKTLSPMPDPDALYLPLKTRRFHFTDVRVGNDDTIGQGDTLAEDPANFSVPLLAPRAGKIVYSPSDPCITLTHLAKTPAKAKPADAAAQLPHVAPEMGDGGRNRYKLLSLGAWEYVSDAYTGALPDPFGICQAVVVSTVAMEPFVARGDAQLGGKLLNFTRGLEHIQSLLEYQPIYLVMPDIHSQLATQIRDQLRGYAWVKLVEIPPKYPFDNFSVLARHLGLKPAAGPVWCLRTEGALAVDQALTGDKPCLTRIVAIGGPPVSSPRHYEVLPGHPLADLAARAGLGPNVRLLDGGALTGKKVKLSDKSGLDPECRGLTALAEQTDREFLGFVRPGADRRSYAACFLSTLRGKFSEKLTTGMRGEPRPCIGCNFCEEVCPAGILPYLIHKHLYADQIDEAAQARVDLCVECGLCSFVCPCKIELMQQFIDAKAVIAKEKAEAEAAAAKAAAAEEAARQAAQAAAAQESR